MELGWEGPWGATNTDAPGEVPEVSSRGDNAVSAKALLPGLGEALSSPLRAAFVISMFSLRPA